MSLIVKVYVHGKDRKITLSHEDIFTGINCVVVQHTVGTCLTEPGWILLLAGLVVDDQQSVVATTTYAITSIISIDGPETSSNGGWEQFVYIHGKNFGPNITSNTSF